MLGPAGPATAEGWVRYQASWAGVVQRPASAFEWATAFAVLFLMTKAVIMLALTGGDPLTFGLAEGSALYQTLAAGAYALCGAFVLARGRDAFRLIRGTPLLLALIAVALSSIVWSVSPAVTARRVIGLTGTMAVALFIATRFSPIRFLRLLQALFTTLAVLSLAAVAFFPDAAIHSDIHFGAWRGVFAHKNNFGEAMAMGVAVSALLLSQRGGRKVASGFSLVLCSALLVMSGSRASWAATLCALISIYAVRVASLPFWLRIPTALSAGTVAAIGGTWLLLNAERLLALVGRDLTLTGRTVLWASAAIAGLDHPYFGHGYRAFWLGNDGGVANIGASSSAFAMQIDHGHNGFLDLWLELGVAGLSLFAVLLFAFARRAFSDASAAREPEHRWPLVMLVLMLPVSFATTVILDRNNYYWIIFVVTLLYTYSRFSGAQTLRAPSGRPRAERVA